MEWIRRPQVSVGDHVLTPYGIARVTDLDPPRDGIVTTHGSWGVEELEEMPAPDTSDPEQLETWLRVTAQVIPKSRVETVHVACGCDCEHCYRVDHYRFARPGLATNYQSFHFRNNETCRCPEELCKCL